LQLVDYDSALQIQVNSAMPCRAVVRFTLAFKG